MTDELSLFDLAAKCTALAEEWSKTWGQEETPLDKRARRTIALLRAVSTRLAELVWPNYPPVHAGTIPNPYTQIDPSSPPPPTDSERAVQRAIAILNRQKETGR